MPVRVDRRRERRKSDKKLIERGRESMTLSEKERTPKYCFTGETKSYQHRTLYRIQACRSFGTVKAGEIGGWIQKQENLSHEGTCWVSDAAIVCDDAWIHGDAQIQKWAKVRDEAEVYGYVVVSDCAIVSEQARLTQHAEIFDHAKVKGCAVISDRARIQDYAEISDQAWVYQYAVVGGWEQIGGRERIISDSLNKKHFQRKLQFWTKREQFF